MQAITNPIALELSEGVRKAVEPNEFVNETLNRKDELEQLKKYFLKQQQKVAAVSMEKMVLTAIKSGFSAEVIETLRKEAGVTESRLEELREQTKMA